MQAKLDGIVPVRECIATILCSIAMAGLSNKFEKLK
jgi:hypothetical protein